MVLNEHKLFRIIQECILREMNKEMHSDIEAVQDFLQQQDKDMSFFKEFPGAECAFLLTNGQIVYVSYHGILDHLYPMEELGAIRLSKGVDGISLAKYPTQAQFASLQRVLKTFFTHEFTIEIKNASCDNRNYKKYRDLEQRARNLYDTVKEKFTHELSVYRTSYIQKTKDLWEKLNTLFCHILDVYPDMDIIGILKRCCMTPNQIQALYEKCNEEFINLKLEVDSICNHNGDSDDLNFKEIVIDVMRSFADMSNIPFVYCNNSEYLKFVINCLIDAVEENDMYIDISNFKEDIVNYISDSFLNNLIGMVEQDPDAYSHYYDIFFNERYGVGRKIISRIVTKILQSRSF